MSSVPPPRSQEYAAVQDRLGDGWNTWDTRSLATHVLLPDGFAIRLRLKEYYRGTVLDTVQIGRPEPDTEEVRLGRHALDGSYTELTVEWNGLRVRIETAHSEGDLVVAVETLENQPKSGLVLAAPAFVWGFPGSVRKADDGAVVGSSANRPDVVVYGTHEHQHDPYLFVDGPVIAQALSAVVGFSTGRRRSIEEIRRIVDAARERTDAALEDFAEPTHGAIVRDAVAWNTLYEPAGARVVTMVSRLWNVQKRGGYALFCWDAFFGALLAALGSADLAHANALEMLREVTPDGFVPNVAQGTGRRTYDGSQPPVGSMVCLALFRSFGEMWFLRDAFPTLLSWNRWWWRVRRTDALIRPGSTRFAPQAPSPQDAPRIFQHFGATTETGLDGHPVFTDVPFDESDGMLQAYDVGLNAEYAVDCEALAEIATLLGEPEAADELREREARVKEAIRERLWDPVSGIYRNHRTTDETPTGFLAPTSFYPMLAGVAPPERAGEMVRQYLMAPDQFGGDWPLRSFPPGEVHDDLNPYWRDRAWPPVNFLVYLGLRRAGEDKARRWLAERSAEMVRIEHEERGHVHENYSSLTGQGCGVDNSQPYLTWGALLSLIALIEAGDVEDWIGASSSVARR